MSVAQEPAPQGREAARTEHERTPVRRWTSPAPIPLPADARLRSWLVRGYEGYDGPSLPHAPTMLLPATLATQLGVYVSCSPSRPPALAMGPSGTYTRVDGTSDPGIVI